jgi:hypothetical protein
VRNQIERGLRAKEAMPKATSKLSVKAWITTTSVTNTIVKGAAKSKYHPIM